jgi:hypothetical protein
MERYYKARYSEECHKKGVPVPSDSLKKVSERLAHARDEVPYQKALRYQRAKRALDAEEEGAQKTLSA